MDIIKIIEIIGCKITFRKYYFRIEAIGYDLTFQKSYFAGFHYTDYMNDNDYSDKPYECNFSVDQRIKALAGHHRYIEWTFASFSEAIQAYGIDAVETLNGVIESLVRIRNTLKDANATDKQLKVYDDKVCECFNLVILAINNRILSDNNKYINQDRKLLNAINNYDINNYHCRITEIQEV